MFHLKKGPYYLEITVFVKSRDNVTLNEKIVILKGCFFLDDHGYRRFQVFSGLK